jgi:predicted nuclease of predicted toxin-antitoxin system
MRLLIDENVPRSVTKFFQDRGHQTTLVSEVLMPSTPDLVLAEVGDRFGLIVVSWNTKDFRRLAERAPKGGHQRFRKLGRISFKCPEPMGVKRLEKLIELIELEYKLVQQERDHRLIVEISSNTIRMIR